MGRGWTYPGHQSRRGNRKAYDENTAALSPVRERARGRRIRREEATSAQSNPVAPVPLHRPPCAVAGFVGGRRRQRCQGFPVDRWEALGGGTIQGRLGGGRTRIAPEKKEELTPDAVLIDAAGRRRSKVTRSGYLTGRAPHDTGDELPRGPAAVEEIIAVMRAAGDDRHGLRVRAGDRGAVAPRPEDLRGSRSAKPMSTQRVGRC
jgi:hypothetical protein